MRIQGPQAVNRTTPASGKDVALRDGLSRRFERDQSARRTAAETRSPADWDVVVSIDRDNTAWMRKVVDENGWPRIAQVGEVGSNQAWLLVQHADLAPDFQAQCLPLLEQAAREGEASLANVAYLTDRVCSNQGQPQVYATQFLVEGGVLVPERVAPPATLEAVNSRRAAMGLSTIQEYAKELAEFGGMPVDLSSLEENGLDAD